MLYIYYMKDLIIFAVLLFFLFMLMTQSDSKYSYNKYGYRKYGYNKNKKETVGGAIDNDPNNMNDDENKLFNMIDTNNDANIDADEFYDFMNKEHSHSDDYVTKDEFNAHNHEDEDIDAIVNANEEANTNEGSDGAAAQKAQQEAEAAAAAKVSIDEGSMSATATGGGFNDVMGYDMDDNYNYL